MPQLLVERSQDVQPQAGPLFARVAKMPIADAELRRVLALIAAYADAGQDDPALNELGRRLDISWGRVESCIRVLEHDGLLAVRWVTDEEKARKVRNRYRVLAGDWQEQAA
jgi:hypothetical protein